MMRILEVDPVSSLPISLSWLLIRVFDTPNWSISLLPRCFEFILLRVISHAGFVRQKKMGPDTQCMVYLPTWKVTLPKFNIAPENRPSQKETSLPTIIFQGLC